MSLTRFRLWLVWAVLRLYAVSRPKVVIELDGSPYLTRWFLTSRPRKGETGTPGVYLHKWHRPDADRRLHCHPWIWARTMILRGAYVEARRMPDGDVRFKRLSVGDGSWLMGRTYHRIVWIAPNTWTLFSSGPKHGRGWNFEAGF